MSEHRYASGEEPMIRDIVERVDERGGHSHIKPNELLVVTSIEAPVEGLSSERLINHALYPCRFRLIARSAKPEHFSAAEPSPYNGANAVSSDTNPTVDWSSDHPKQNTDREIWHDRDDHGYGPSIFVTQGGAIGINVGGTAIVAPVQAWHSSASDAGNLRAEVERLKAELEGVTRARNQSWLDASKIAEICKPVISDAGLYPTEVLVKTVVERLTKENEILASRDQANQKVFVNANNRIIELYKERDEVRQELSAIVRHIKPNMSNDMPLSDEVIIAWDNLKQERDAIAKQLECEKANSEHRWELAKKYSKCVGKIRVGLGNDAKRFPSDELPAFAESLRKERDELKNTPQRFNELWKINRALQLFDGCTVSECADEIRKIIAERDELRAKLDESEAAAAKVREALESALPETRETRGVESWVVTFDDGSDWHCGAEPFMRLCDVFYSTTAGREFLAERDKMLDEIESLKSKLRKIKTELSFGC